MCIAKEFNGKRHLSTLFSDSTIEEISDIDIGYVAEDSSDTDTFTHHQLHNVWILGVQYLYELKKCLNCNSKVVVGIDSTYPEIGECTKCRMMQNTESCETLLTTHILVKSSEMPSPMTLTATGDMVHKLCCNEDTKITKMALLTCPPFSLTYKDDMIHSISR